MVRWWIITYLRNISSCTCIRLNTLIIIARTFTRTFTGAFARTSTWTSARTSTWTSAWTSSWTSAWTSSCAFNRTNLTYTAYHRRLVSLRFIIARISWWRISITCYTWVISLIRDYCKEKTDILQTKCCSQAAITSCRYYIIRLIRLSSSFPRMDWWRINSLIT